MKISQLVALCSDRNPVSKHYRRVCNNQKRGREVKILKALLEHVEEYLMLEARRSHLNFRGLRETSQITVRIFTIFLKVLILKIFELIL